MRRTLFTLLLFASALSAQVLRDGNLTLAGTLNHCGPETGSGNSYVCANTKPISTYRAGLNFTFTATHANSGPASLSIDSITSAAITKNGTASLTGGEIAIGFVAHVIFDGTRWQLQASANGGASATPTGPAGGSLAGTFPNPSLATVLSTPGQVGSATQIPVITFNSAGQATSVTTATASGGGGGSSSTDYNVLSFGANPDAMYRTSGSMNAGSPIFTDLAGTFSSADLGKRIEVVGAGSGGTTMTACSIPSNSKTLTCTGGTFTNTDVGRGIVVPGAGAAGSLLSTHVFSVTSGTVIALSDSNASGNAVTGVSSYLGYMTLLSTISSVGSATSVTLADNAVGTVGSAPYVVGTDNATAIQSAIDSAGSSSGGVVRLPLPKTCPAAAVCGYLVLTTNISTSKNPSALKIRNSNVTLAGVEGQQTPLFCRGAASVLSNTTSQGASPATIRGNCLNIGDADVSNAGLLFKNVTVEHLHFYGMTNGLSFQGAFDPHGVQLTTTLDGWDTTGKGIYIAGDDRNDNVLINDVTIESTKGEQIFSGGGFRKMVITNSTMIGSNADAISVSARDLTVANNVMREHLNGAVEDGTFSASQGTTFDTIRHFYVNNIIEDCPSEAIILVGVDAGVNGGTFFLDHNVFNRIGQVHGTAAQVAVYATFQNGSTPTNLAPANIIATNNTCRDSVSCFNIQVSAHAEIRNNTMIVDQYPVSNFLSAMQPENDVLVTGNHGYATAAAIAAGRKPATIYALNIGYQTGNLTYHNFRILNNEWTFPGQSVSHWNYSVTQGGGLSLMSAGKYPSFGMDSCAGCVYPDADHGLQDVSTSHQVEPIGPVISVTASSTVPVTINTAKSEPNSIVVLYNSGTNPLTFTSDANQYLPFSGAGSLNPGTSATLRLDPLMNKWVQF